MLDMVARQLHRLFRGRVPVDELRSLGAAAAAEAMLRWDGRGSFEAFAAQRIEWGMLRELKRQARRDRRASFRDHACALAAAGDAIDRALANHRRTIAEADAGTGEKPAGSFVGDVLSDMAAGFTVELSTTDAAHVVDPESDVERDTERFRVVRAIRTLPAATADLLERYYYRGETLEEIGRELGLEKSTVHDRLGRALAKLKELLCPKAVGEVVSLRGR